MRSSLHRHDRPQGFVPSRDLAGRLGIGARARRAPCRASWCGLNPSPRRARSNAASVLLGLQFSYLPIFDEGWGFSGAPRLGDALAWATQKQRVVVLHVINGFILVSDDDEALDLDSGIRGSASLSLSLLHPG